MMKEPKMTIEAPMYIYATEMVASYYRRLKLKGKRVLTIAGSGDQVINAVFYGAKEVIGFDINRNALFITQLKLAAIKTISYGEFVIFFSQTGRGFHHEMYIKIRPLLLKAPREYFDRLYVHVGRKGLGLSEYFRNRNELIYKNKNNVNRINGYLANETAYNKAREILANTLPRLYIQDILKLTESNRLRGKKFDVINLSNVPNYLTGRSFGLSEEAVLSYLRRLKKLVSRGGIIFFYSYTDSIYPHSTSPDVPPVSRSAFLDKLIRLNIFKVTRKSFYGVFGEYDRITLLGC
jgi:S-adenosylmethionine:diacylglycerol 3-amino-3-carboxypropyl transferase